MIGKASTCIATLLGFLMKILFVDSVVICGFSTAQGVGVPNPHAVQGSTEQIIEILENLTNEPTNQPLQNRLLYDD